MLYRQQYIVRKSMNRLCVLMYAYVVYGVEALVYERQDDIPAINPSRDNRLPIRRNGHSAAGYVSVHSLKHFSHRRKRHQSDLVQEPSVQRL